MRRISRLLWLALPLGLTVGCAHTQNYATAQFAPLPTAALAPTSNRAEPRIYAGGTGFAEDYSAPPGASPADWNLAEEIRDRLTTDHAWKASPVTAVVNNGQVTLRGEVPNDTQRREVTQMVASLPGVQRVNDQLQLGNPAVFWKRSNANY